MSNVKDSNRYILMTAIFVLILSLLPTPFSHNSIFVLSFVIPLVMVFVVFRKKMDVKVAFPGQTLGKKNYIFLIILGVLLAPALSILNDLVNFIVNPPSEPAFGEIFLREGSERVTLLYYAIVPIVFSELSMRGIMLSGYKDVPIFKAAVINGLMTGAFFLSFGVDFALPYAILGFILCLIVYHTKSIVSAILFHFSFSAAFYAFIAQVIARENSDVSMFDLNHMPGVGFGMTNIPEDFIVDEEWFFMFGISAITAVLLITSWVLLAAFYFIFQQFVEHNSHRNKQAAVKKRAGNAEPAAALSFENLNLQERVIAKMAAIDNTQYDVDDSPHPTITKWRQIITLPLIIALAIYIFILILSFL